MAAWPLAILITGGAALFIRTLVTVTVMRASANLLYNSFFRAGFELLYTPIAPADKRAGKVLIDVGADRSGDLLGGLVVMTILLIPVATESILLSTGLILAVVCLALIMVLHRGYVGQLADNLRDGHIRPEELEIVDATTAHTVATTQTAIERDRLLRDIARYTDAGRPEPAPMISTPPPGVVDAVTESIIELRSGVETRIRRTLTSHTMTAELLPHAIPLLADERVLREALSAVRKMASTGAGQLVDALLTPRQHPLVKRRLPLILAQSDSPLAVQGLSAGLDDPDWNVRFRCAQALETIRRRYAHLAVNEERLLAIAEREARALPGASTDRATAQGGIDASHRGVQFLFLLFGTLYEPETLDLCLRALQSGDRGLQGTALEYLENLLPAHIWALLQPVLAPTHKRSKKKRPLQQAARELAAAASSLRPKPKPGNTDVDAADAIE